MRALGIHRVVVGGAAARIGRGSGADVARAGNSVVMRVNCRRYVDQRGAVIRVENLTADRKLVLRTGCSVCRHGVAVSIIRRGAADGASQRARPVRVRWQHGQRQRCRVDVVSVPTCGGSQE